ncbi:hypothetical protein BABINDRAFT_163106 [Babjeviella inositovora NRRL Y-12698]|uniref:Uncharacterized protein n=1 Tax=Babjeviella inositovora NRRL Y-12698 TaxID=984486 RepID=A0A1E3QK64_9ASCO|nr:uncharacterized protein BABINDRAFT_163106 [Babjeviella inositovora NRRL Y-12698]ODQ78081.1 hypothetical protein BABINDRAFT_163106 [Babjeviella inositovora NRRL Y-12698]
MTADSLSGLVAPLSAKLMQISALLSVEHDVLGDIALSLQNQTVYADLFREFTAIIPAEVQGDAARCAKVVELAYSRFQASLTGSCFDGVSQTDGFVRQVINMAEFAFSMGGKLGEIPFLLIYDALIYTPDSRVVHEIWHRYVNSPVILARLKQMRLVGARRPGTTLVLLVNQLTKTLRLVQSPENYDFMYELQTFIAEILPFNEITFQNRLLDVNERDVAARYPGVAQAEGKKTNEMIFRDFWYLQSIFSNPYDIMSRKLARDYEIERGFIKLQGAVDSLLDYLVGLDKDDKSLKEPVDPYRVLPLKTPRPEDLEKYVREDVRVTFPHTPDTLVKYLDFHTNRLVIFNQIYILLSLYDVVAEPRKALAKTAKYAANPAAKAIETSPIDVLNLNLYVPGRVVSWLVKTRASIPSHFKSLKLTTLYVQSVVASDSDLTAWLPYVIDGFPDFWTQQELSAEQREATLSEMAAAFTRHQAYKKRFWTQMMNPQLNKVWKGPQGEEMTTLPKNEGEFNEDERKVKEWRSARRADTFAAFQGEEAEASVDELTALDAQLKEYTVEYEKHSAALDSRKRSGEEKDEPKPAKRAKLEY